MAETTGRDGSMSITDELREWFKDRLFMGNGYAELNAIADHIDAEHDQMRDFCERLERAVTDREDVTLWGVDYTALPLDADGVPWHIGDRTESGQTVGAMGLNKHGWCFIGTVNEIDPSIHRHYKQPTVEDVLTEFAAKLIERSGLTNGAAQTIAEYAKRLTLAEGEDK